MNFQFQMRLISQLLFALLFITITSSAYAVTGNAKFISGSYNITTSSDGSTAQLSLAGVKNITSSTTSGSLGFQLYYSTTPYAGGGISGVVVASASLPIGNCTSSQLAPGASCTSIQVSSNLTLPGPGTYYPILALTEFSSTGCSASNGLCLDDAIALANTQTGGPTVTVNATTVPNATTAPGANGKVSLSGSTSYAINGSNISIAADKISNNTTSSTGSLRLTIFASKTQIPVGGTTISGYTLGSYKISGSNSGTLGPNQFFSNISATVPYTPPPADTYFVTMLLEEYKQSCGSADGYCTDDLSAFPNTAVLGGGGGTPVLTPSIKLGGNQEYNINGDSLLLKVGTVTNTGSSTTGSLQLRLYASDKQYSGTANTAFLLGSYKFPGTLAPLQLYTDTAVTTAYTAPPPGTYYLSLQLLEYTQNCGSTDGYCVDDYTNFPTPLSLGLTIGSPAAPGSATAPGGTTPAPAPDVGLPPAKSGGGALDILDLLGIAITALIFKMRRRSTKILS